MAHKTLPMTGPKGTKLRYITKEEEKLLKERERSKGSITDKFYKGVPVLYTEAEDAAGRAAFGEAGGSSGADMMGAGDLVDALHGLGFEGAKVDTSYSGPIAGTSSEGWVGDPGSGGGSADDIDDKAEYMSEEECKRRGGTWDGAMCHWDGSPPPPGGDDDGEEEEEGSPEYDPDAPYEKGATYKHKDFTPKTSAPVSETTRAKTLEDKGKSIADSVRSHLTGEVAGIGRKSAELGEYRDTKAEDAERLAELQRQAAKGMAFSTPHFDAEVDLIEKWADTGLMREDEAAKLQYELDMKALTTMEPIEALLAAGEIGGAGMEGTFKPGAIASGEYMDTGFGLGSAPTFSGLPSKGIPHEAEAEAEAKADDDTGTSKPAPTSHYTDKNGDVCYYEERFEDKNGDWICPGTTVGGEA